MSACNAPIDLPTLVAYWAGDMPVDDVDRIDEHLMGCASCTASSERVARVVQGLRELIPPFVSAAQVAELRARGLVVVENPTLPGDRHDAVFREGTDILLHRLGGLDLADVERVGVRILVEGSGEVLLTEPAVPFERDTGEILVACQRHFAVFPPDIVFEVRARTRTGEERVTTYEVPHVFG
jgi:hypothetical protein